LDLLNDARGRIIHFTDAGWSSLAARRAHNPKVTGSNPVPATRFGKAVDSKRIQRLFAFAGVSA
jgi:hypothetical protein